MPSNDVTKKARRDWLTKSAAAAKSEPVSISVRDLLGMWNAQRRGFWIVQEIEKDLASVKLRTDPPFTGVWIDSRVRLVAEAEAETEPPATDDTDAEVGLRIRQLPSANLELVSINPTESLARAQALMMRHDYSQLPVLSSVRDPAPKAVTWESIAQAREPPRDR